METDRPDPVSPRNVAFSNPSEYSTWSSMRSRCTNESVGGGQKKEPYLNPSYLTKIPLPLSSHAISLIRNP